MSAATYNLNIDQGSIFKKSLVVKDDQNNLIDLTGCSAAMQIRPYRSSNEILVNATTSNGHLTVNQATSEIEINLSEQQTMNLIYSKSIYEFVNEKI